MHGVDADADADVLLLHGLGSNAAGMWAYEGMLAPLGLTTHAVDLRGHGAGPRGGDHSRAGLTRDIAALRSTPWSLVIGHSLGGAVAITAAAADPAFTRRLIAIDPALLFDDAAIDRLRESALAERADPAPDRIRARHPGWTDRDIAAKAAALEALDEDAVRAIARDFRPWNVMADAAALHIPTLVVAADPAMDALVTPALAAELRRNPHIEVATVEGAGHSIHRDRPAALAVVLQHWLRTPTGPPPAEGPRSR